MESLPDASVRLAYSITETAQLIGLSKRTVERLITRRELRAVAVGRRVLVPADELARFLGVQACAKAQVPLGPPAVLRAPVSEPLAARLDATAPEAELPGNRPSLSSLLARIGAQRSPGGAD